MKFEVVTKNGHKNLVFAVLPVKMGYFRILLTDLGLLGLVTYS